MLTKTLPDETWTKQPYSCRSDKKMNNKKQWLLDLSEKLTEIAKAKGEKQ